MIKIFLYGTLKTNKSNNRLLNKNCRFISIANTKLGDFVLYTELYPYMVRKENDTNNSPDMIVHGELWEIDKHTLSILDTLEGHPDYYKREVIEIVCKGEILKVYSYIYPEPEGILLQSGEF